MCLSQPSVTPSPTVSSPQSRPSFPTFTKQKIKRGRILFFFSSSQLTSFCRDHQTITHVCDVNALFSRMTPLGGLLQSRENRFRVLLIWSIGNKSTPTLTRYLSLGRRLISFSFHSRDRPPCCCTLQATYVLCVTHTSLCYTADEKEVDGWVIWLGASFFKKE